MRIPSGAWIKILFAAVAASGISVWAGTSTAPAPAQEQPAPVPQEASTVHTLRDEEGRAMRFTLRHSVNEHGEREVAVDFEETRALLPDTRVTLLYGRDLDADGFYDAWFLIRPTGGIDVRESRANRGDGWDAIRSLLTQEVKIQKRSAARVLFHAAATHLTMTGAAQESYLEKFTRRQIDLYDLELRNQRYEKEHPRDRLVLTQAELIADGWLQLSEEIRDKAVREQFLWAAADIVSIFVGGVLIKAVAVPVRWAAPKVVESGFGEVAHHLYDSYVKDISHSSAQAMSRAKHALSKSTGGAGRAVVAAKLSIQEKVALQIRGLEARGRIGHAFGVTLRRVGASIREAAREFKYVGVSTSLQRGAQMYLDKGEAEEDPLVVARGIVTNPDLLANTSFVAIEKLVMARARANGASRAEQVALSGVLVTGKATAMTYYTQDELDPGRIALNATFDATVGNLDMVALDHFERMAAAKGNPKVKLLGYAVVLVDNVVGTAAYRWASDEYEEAKSKELRLVPLFVGG